MMFDTITCSDIRRIVRKQSIFHILNCALVIKNGRYIFFQVVFVIMLSVHRTMTFRPFVCIRKRCFVIFYVTLCGATRRELFFLRVLISSRLQPFRRDARNTYVATCRCARFDRGHRRLVRKLHR